MKILVMIIMSFLLIEGVYAQDFENLIAGENAVIFSQRKPLIGTEISFEQQGGIYDVYYSDKGTGWRWRSSPHWKIVSNSGYMKFSFQGQKAFVFTALGSESGGKSRCNIQIFVNNVQLKKKFYLPGSWGKYYIPKEYFNTENNIVKIVQLPGTSMWITEAHISDFDLFDGSQLVKAKEDNRNNSAYDNLGQGISKSIVDKNDISDLKGDIQISNAGISLYKASFKIAALQSAKEFELEFNLTCQDGDDFKIGFGNGRVLRFSKTRTTFTKWMGTNFSAPLFDLAVKNHNRPYRILYKDRTLKIYHNDKEYFKLGIDINIQDLRFLTGGKMRALLEGLKIKYI